MWGKLSRLLSLVLTVLLTVQGACAESGTLMKADLVRCLRPSSHQGAALTDADRLVAQSQALQLYYDSAQGIIKVLDRRNQYVFSSGRTDETASKLSKKWKKVASSLLQGDFIDAVTMNTLQETPEVESLSATPVENGLVISGVFPTARIGFTLSITLQEDELILRVADESLVATDAASSYELLSLSVMPFFGASHQDDGDGYAFAPDGCGALIHFDAPRASRALSMKVYGADVSAAELGTVKTAREELPAREMKSASVPVLGLVHGQGQNAVMLSVTGGEEYCNLYVNPMGNNNLPFCYACVQAVYNQQYNQQNEGREGFRMILSQREHIPLEIRYTFLTGDDAGYAGMARRYRQSLVESGQLTDGQSGQISLMIDCLMQESRKSIYGTSTVQMTAFQDIVAWRRALTQQGVGQIVWSLEGTADGGVSRSSSQEMAISRSLGDASLLSELTDRGDAVLLNQELFRFYPEQLPDRFRIYMANRQYTSQAAYGYLNDTVYFQSLDQIEKLLPKLIEQNQFDGLSVDTLARMIYSNFARNHGYRRDDALERTRAILHTMGQSGLVAASLPGKALFPLTDYAYDLPLSHSMLVFEGEPVPFLQMVLSGAIPCYTEAMVAGASPEETLLRMIDFNCYPHYVLTEQASTLLVKTNSNRVFSSQADHLLEAIAEEYALLNEVLGPVAGQQMLDRVTPQDGLAVITYESGIRIAVNYNRTSRRVGNVEIPALSARLVEKEEW